MRWCTILPAAILGAILIVAGALAGVEASESAWHAERDSLRARTEELESGIRQYIMAAALLAQRNQVLEGQLSWCMNTPMPNAP